MFVESCMLFSNELFHHYHSKWVFKKARLIIPTAYSYPGQIVAAVVHFVSRSKSKELIPMYYNPDVLMYIDKSKVITKDDVEYEHHGQHHWFNAPFYGYGITDYYFGREYNGRSPT